MAYGISNITIAVIVQITYKNIGIRNKIVCISYLL